MLKLIASITLAVALSATAFADQVAPVAPSKSVELTASLPALSGSDRADIIAALRFQASVYRMQANVTAGHVLHPDQLDYYTGKADECEAIAALLETYDVPAAVRIVAPQAQKITVPIQAQPTNARR